MRVQFQRRKIWFHSLWIFFFVLGGRITYLHTRSPKSNTSSSYIKMFSATWSEKDALGRPLFTFQLLCNQSNLFNVDFLYSAFSWRDTCQTCKYFFGQASLLKKLLRSCLSLTYRWCQSNRLSHACWIVLNTQVRVTELHTTLMLNFMVGFFKSPFFWSW